MPEKAQTALRRHSERSKPTDDLRVLDYSGFNGLDNFPVSIYGREIRHES